MRRLLSLVLLVVAASAQAQWANPGARPHPGRTTHNSVLLGGQAGSPVTFQSFATAPWNFNLPASAGSPGQVLTSQGGAGAAMTWGGGSSSLSAITAATAPNTIASGNNTAQVWNWANTADSTVAFTYGETSAASAGTSTSGVPNQVLLKVTTVAASTQSPLSVFSRGSHVFSVSPTVAQILATGGSAANPAYSSTANVASGVWMSGNDVHVTANGQDLVKLNSGTAAAFEVTDSAGSFPVSGLAVITGITTSASNANFGALRTSADTTGTIIYGRKSRGTVASPTAITTGDTLLAIGGYGHVGATNTYVEATRISSISTGTITDATNGIGGQLRFATAKQGVDTGPIERLRVDDLGHINSVAGTANTPTMGACGTSPTVAGTDSVMDVTVGTGGAATACVVNFGSTWTTNAPICTVTTNTVADAALAITASSTTSYTVTKATALTASSHLFVHCIGRL